MSAIIFLSSSRDRTLTGAHPSCSPIRWPRLQNCFCQVCVFSYLLPSLPLILSGYRTCRMIAYSCRCVRFDACVWQIYCTVCLERHRDQARLLGGYLQPCHGGARYGEQGAEQHNHSKPKYECLYDRGSNGRGGLQVDTRGRMEVS